MGDAKIFSWNLKDISKGFITAFITALITALYQLVQDGHLPTLAEFKTAGLVGLSAGLAYLLKNFLTNSADQFLTKEPPK